MITVSLYHKLCSHAAVYQLGSICAWCGRGIIQRRYNIREAQKVLYDHIPYNFRVREGMWCNKHFPLGIIYELESYNYMWWMMWIIMSS